MAAHVRGRQSVRGHLGDEAPDWFASTSFWSLVSMSSRWEAATQGYSRHRSSVLHLKFVTK
jgi:hypothetical protein